MVWQLGQHSVTLPIVQGGMGIGISLAGLASAVAREGGIGCISAVGLGWDETGEKITSLETHKTALTNEIILARKNAPQGVIGVNIMMALSNYEELIVTAASAGADVIFLGAGLPLILPSEVISMGKQIALVPIVSSGRAARLIRDAWIKKYNRMPDAFVVEGPLAGGHLGFKREEISAENNSLENILDSVLSVANETSDTIPVIAGGGIFTAKDVRAILARGATAVQLGTRFVATWECDASLEFKESYINSSSDDVQIIPSPVGLPGRAISSPFLSALAAGELPHVNCRYRCLRSCNPATTPYCIARALIAAKKGDFKNGFAFCGANVHKVNKIISVKELLHELLN